jgi:putative cell wall-binding protein
LLAAGNYTIDVDPAQSDLVSKSKLPLVLREGEAVTGFDIVLDRTSGIQGTLRYEGEGAPSPSTVRLHITGQPDVRPNPDGTFEFRSLRPGSYVMLVTPDNADTYVTQFYKNSPTPEGATKIVVEANKPPTVIDVVVPRIDYPLTNRINGADRYAVAVKISQQAFPSGAPVVYLATGEDYPDALSAGAAAAEAGGPLLITPRGTLPASVAAEIRRLAPSKVVLVGGPNAVSTAVGTSVKKIVKNTVRVTGADRYAVSRTLALDLFGKSGADVVYIATGRNFPDALSAGAAAGFEGGPLLLVDGSAQALDAETKAALHTLAPTRIVIAGGPQTVTTALEAALKSYGDVERLSGSDRFETSVAINLDSYASARRAFLVTGSNFPDALSGSAYAGKLGAPVYLSRQDCVPVNTLSALEQQEVKTVTLLGGLQALSQRVSDLVPCS